MDILYLLIPVSVVIVFLVGLVFFWAIASGQFDGLDREGESVVEDRDSESQYKNPRACLRQAQGGYR